MLGKATDWNVVVLGAWNVAILTPKGIASELMQLGPEIPVEIFVPLDRQAPIRVAHNSIYVEPSPTQLVVAPVVPSAEQLRMATKVASRALEKLPRTPVSAAGVNLRYEVENPSPELAAATACDLDALFADADSVVSARMQKWTLAWEDGVVNVQLDQMAGGKALLSFNFHRASAVGPDLMRWLERVGDMETKATELAKQVFGLGVEQ